MKKITNQIFGKEPLEEKTLLKTTQKILKVIIEIIKLKPIYIIKIVRS